MRRKRRLHSAISSGKELLPEDEQIDSPSRLAKKLGVSRSERKRISLLQRTSDDKRTPYSRIADRVLGEQSGKVQRIIEIDEKESEYTGVGPWISERFDVLRTLSGEEEITDDERWLGHDDSGRPIWENVLDEQRRRLGWKTDEEYVIDEFPELPPLEQEHVTPGDWPPILPSNESLTFRNYHVCPQNERAAHAINEALDKPAQRLNPLLLMGEDGCGKTHLLWATGWAFTRQDPEKVARILSCSTIDSEFSLPKNWSERFAGTSVLLVDDVHLLHNKPDVMHSIGMVVDWALNLGIQVILTGIDSSTGPSNRLSQVIRKSVKVELGEPTRDSLILMLRSHSAGRNLLLNDEMLAAIADRCGPGWGPTSAGLEELTVAIESGDEVLDSKDVVRILSGRSPSKPDEIPEKQDLEELGEEIAAEILDTVFADPLNPAVEIRTVLPEIGDDEYEPPELMPESSMEAVRSVVDRHIRDDVARLRENVDSALLPDERDAHLAASPSQLPFEDKVNVAMDLSPLSLNAGAAFERLENDLESQRENISNLESELYSIAMQIDKADSKDLIRLIDDLREVEERLAEIDPEKLPLPEFEEAKIRRRAFKRLSRPEPVKERLDVVLEPAPIREVIKPTIAVLRPTNILVPVE